MKYCILHEKMVKEEHIGLLKTEFGEFSGHTFYFNGKFGIEVDFCEFEQGWATCPPPEFDLREYILREYIERVGAPPIWEDFLPYEYDVERDEIVEVLP